MASIMLPLILDGESRAVLRYLAIVSQVLKPTPLISSNEKGSSLIPVSSYLASLISLMALDDMPIGDRNFVSFLNELAFWYPLTRILSFSAFMPETDSILSGSSSMVLKVSDPNSFTILLMMSLPMPKKSSPLKNMLSDCPVFGSVII